MAWGAVPIVSALACFRDFVTPSHNGIVFDHRGANSVANLTEVFAGLPQQPLEAMSRGALHVRETHAPKRIAAQFLDDFESIRREKPRKP
jgi:16S rRNA G966 N2-methylase RsmD